MTTHLKYYKYCGKLVTKFTWPKPQKVKNTLNQSKHLCLPVNRCTDRHKSCSEVFHRESQIATAVLLTICYNENTHTYARIHIAWIIMLQVERPKTYKSSFLSHLSHINYSPWSLFQMVKTRPSFPIMLPQICLLYTSRCV